MEIHLFCQSEGEDRGEGGKVESIQRKCDEGVDGGAKYHDLLRLLGIK